MYKKAHRLGFLDGQEAASDSGEASAPADGWDGWLINSIGLSATCKLLGEPAAANRHGWTEAMRAKLEAYHAGACEGAAFAMRPEPKSRREPMAG